MEAYFKSLHGQKGIGRNAEQLKRMYNVMLPKDKAEFKNLTVEKQIDLLAVPVKKQARFKREGVDVYAGKVKDKSRVSRGMVGMLQRKRREEQRKHQHVANGGWLVHEPVNQLKNK